MENLKKELHNFNLSFLQNTSKKIVVIPSGGDATTCYEFLYKNAIDIHCFIDNNSEKQGVEIDSKNILSLDELTNSQQNYHFIVASKKFEEELVAQLIENNIEDYSLFDSSRDVPFLDITEENAFKNYTALFNLLDDQQSKETLLSIINFRITHDSNFLNKIVRPISNQYFEPSIYQVKNNDYFVDCGAYDGDTLKLLLSHTNNEIAGYYGFEPNEHNYKMLDKRSKSYENIELIKKGVFSKDATLSFEIPYDTISSSSSISNSGTAKIEVTSIDSALKEQIITFIKMDIEGAEIDALIGAKNSIQNQKPVLAISVYHKFDDLWEIPLLIERFGVNYKYYLRHYTLNSSETILYCIPISN